MFDLALLKKKKVYVTICENSIVIVFENIKIVFLAHPDNYVIDIEPPGIRGCNQPVDEYGQVSVSDESVFENGKLYTVKNVVFDDSKACLSLCDSKFNPCTVLLSSPQIDLDMVEIYNFDDLIGENVKLSLVENNLIIESHNSKWIFSAQPENYIVRIKCEIMNNNSPIKIENSTNIQELKNEISCTITDFQYYDDLLGETTITFNLYFTTLSIDLMTEDNKTYNIEIDTEKMKINRLTI